MNQEPNNADGAKEETDVSIGLNAVIVALSESEPRVLVVRRRKPGNTTPEFPMRLALPSGPFRPAEHRTLEIGLRSWVEAQTQERLGYVEQLYTFGDRGREARSSAGDGPRHISVGYLALVRPAVNVPGDDAVWRDWYGFFPWEDWRAGPPAVLKDQILPALSGWADQATTEEERSVRHARIKGSFGASIKAWVDELVLERYELLYEAGLVAEAHVANGGDLAPVDMGRFPGDGMAHDHRRILATAMGRLRGKIKYRPLIFELMPPSFTLFQLQRAVEGMAGLNLHKQNFRRLVEARGLVERTGDTLATGPGRPAALFRFRPDVLVERMAPVSKLPARRT